jgi:predicted permease
MDGIRQGLANVFWTVVCVLFVHVLIYGSAVLGLVVERLGFKFLHALPAAPAQASEL